MSANLNVRRRPVWLSVVLALIAGLVGVSVLEAPATRAEQEEAPYPRDSAMAVARAHHTASLLPDGRVLVAGGTASNTGVVDPAAWSATATAEFYDPDGDSWLPAPPMTTPRTKHTATVLDGPTCRDENVDAVTKETNRCGSVLVTGGYVDGKVEYAPSATSTTSLFRSSSESVGGGLWETGPEMVSARAEHTATLLDGPECQVPAAGAPAHCGKVLIVGGFGIDRDDSAAPDSTVMIHVADEVELYDPRTGELTVAGKLTTPRARHAAVLLGDGRVAILAGVTSSPQVGTPTLRDSLNPESTNSLEIYDPKIDYDAGGTGQGPLSSGPSMLKCENGSSTCHKDHRAGATLLPDNTVVVFSGRGGSPEDNWSQKFNPTGASGQGLWTRAGWGVGHPTAESHSSVLLPNGRVLAGVASVARSTVITGTVKTSVITALPAFAYDIDESHWGLFPCPATASCRNLIGGETMTLLADSTVLVAGGADHVPGSGSFGSLVAEAARIRPQFVPNRPRNVTASRSGSQTTLSWSPPANDGGSPVSHYEVVAIEKSSGTRSAPITVQAAQQRSVTHDGTLLTHAYEVFAVNDIGKSLPGSPGLLNVPQAPTSVEASAGEGAAVVQWDRPVEDTPPPADGSAVTGYEVQVAPAPADGVAVVTVAGAETTTAEFTNLTNGTSYVFTVVASSANGRGRSSLPSAPIVPGTIQSAPRITAVEARDRSALVSWTAAPNPVGTIDSYVVTASPGGATATVPAAANVAVVPGLTNNTGYRFTVRGVNGVGFGPSSASWPSLPTLVTPTRSSVAAPPPLPTTAPTDVPVVLSVVSRGGPVTGGPEVVVTGKGFATTSAVAFVEPPSADGKAGARAVAKTFEVISDHQIAVTLPPQAGPRSGGRVTVVVTNPVGDSPSDAAGAWFHYGIGGWTTTGSSSYGLPGVPALLPDGSVLTVAAETAEPATSGRSTASVFDSRKGLWRAIDAATADPTGKNRPVLTVGLPNGNALAFRGHDLFGRSAQVQCLTGLGAACTDPNVPQIYDATKVEGEWVDIAPKSTAANGRAVLLDDGRVLVAGGCCQPNVRPNAAVAAAEVFDPRVAGGTWMPVQPLPLPLVDHTLTVMRGQTGECATKCSNVLAAGGFKRRITQSNGFVGIQEDYEEPLPPPSIFNPATNTWRTTAPMKAPRYGHGAVALPGGKVMVLGGAVHVVGPTDPQARTTQPLATATAEVFDPLTESWSYVAPMTTRRYHPATLLLSDGRILVAGGFSPTGPVADAEIYDPQTDKWSPAGAMTTPGSAQLIELPKTGDCGSNCGRVLAIRENGSIDTFLLPPTVTSLSQTTGPIGGGTEVTITGGRFTPESRVLFGGVPATSVEVKDQGTIVATTPPGALAKSIVTVATDGGATDAAQKFTYTGAPGAVSLLNAQALSPREAELTFGAAGSVGDAAPAASRYVVKQSRSPITEANFDAAPALCGGTCDDFEPSKMGERLRLGISRLTPGTRYHYAVKAIVDGVTGPMVTAVTDTPGVGVGPVGHVSARSLSANSIQLSFGAAGAYESDPPPVGTYVVKQSTRPISDATTFDAATSLCGGRCRFEPGSVGETLTLSVSDLDPSTTYHYAVRADAGSRGLGPMSNVATITTAGPCAPTPPTSPGRVTYPVGYSLVGLPSGTVTNAAALFGWFNLGSGNRYSVHDVDAGVEGGRGYWAYFACPTSVRLAEGTKSADMALGRYRASMVGNPSRAPAELRGHDFAARWDATLNAGAGGYEISGYRQSLPLAPGEGAWAFSYGDTTLSVRIR